MKFLNFYGLILILILTSCTVVVTKINSDIPKDKGSVFLLHGLASGSEDMVFIQNRLEKAGFNVIQIDYRTLFEEPDDALRKVTNEIKENMPDSGTVNFVGHSLGGLMIRAYLDSNKVENLGRVVLIGTPSGGTPFVDKYRDRWWIKLAGKIPLALGTDEGSFPNSIGDPYYPVGVIAGKAGWDNDDLVPGDDDGIVPVASTEVNGMSDIIVLETNHTMLRLKGAAADQVIEFLLNGRFRK